MRSTYSCHDAHRPGLVDRTSERDADGSKEEGGPTNRWNRLAENRVASWFRRKGR